ncbi:hypothetical protein [Planotetraspora silvatica]|uniref:hypothetical protein n=1 Tax=Planotetraspora silvatica TaxID=234614 RepID=UPI001950AFE9|nr:hypothetical protein [Planotetraspora silvatica]
MPDQVLVPLAVGDEAELVTELHLAQASLRVPSARIAEQADPPESELPGRRFTLSSSRTSERHCDGQLAEPYDIRADP